MKGYYDDFYRFTRGGLEYMTKDFLEVEIQNVRGALATVFNLFPFFSKKTAIFEYLDKLFLEKKEVTKQAVIMYFVLNNI